MKRSVAIIGPTPQFVRWAILKDCPLRQIDPGNLPDSTFRQLRGLRELSLGFRDRRVIRGICLHPDAHAHGSANALGFPVGEVLDVHGDEKQVATCCQRCPANISGIDQDNLWAGCYGWLPVEPSNAGKQGTINLIPSLAELVHSADNRDNSGNRGNPDSEGMSKSPKLLIDRMDQVIADLGCEQADELFLPTRPHWYGIWQTTQLSMAQTEFLAEAFSRLAARPETPPSAASTTPISLTRMARALRTCVQNRLTMFVELVPRGESKNGVWTQVAHCPTCKHELEADIAQEQTCPACGRVGNPHGIHKGKVLGLRPYVRLSSVLGEAATIQLMENFNPTTDEDSD